MWHATALELPESGTLCRVITEGLDERDLIYRDGLWWIPDNSMYVYFVPMYWRVK